MSAESGTSNTPLLGCGGIFWLTAAALFVLKLTAYPDISWWLIGGLMLAPLALFLSFMLVIGLIALAGIVIVGLIEVWDDHKRDKRLRLSLKQRQKDGASRPL